MKKLTLLLSLSLIFLILGMSTTMADQNLNLQKDWKLAIQAWSFHNFTFFEAVDKTAQAGIKYIEAFPGQKLSKDMPDAQFDHNMSDEAKKATTEKLRQAGVQLVNYGVVGLANNEAQCRRVFDFAKEMGIRTIVSEPPEEAFDLIDKLCQEYHISVAIHNHPAPSHYWNPDTVLKVCQDRSKWIGACADTGHWVRSGIKPLLALRKLQDRIISFHFKDIDKFGTHSAHDVPWGTGQGNTTALLAEMQKQGFTGVFSAEYEYNWENNVPDIIKCRRYFEKTTKLLQQNDPTEVIDHNFNLAMASYTFHRYKFFEAIDKTAALGLDEIEGYQHHRFSEEKPDTMLCELNRQDKEQLRAKLDNAGVKMSQYFVDLPSNERQCREVFEYAKSLGVKVIVSEPEPEAIEMIDKLANEYDIRVAIHDHPRESKYFPHPSTYWNPDKVAEVCEGRSDMIGACADIGHWIRSGIDPVMALKRLSGRIITLHFKDLNRPFPQTYDCPWGTGVIDFEGIINELKMQGFDGQVSVEYEHHWYTSMPEILDSLYNFRKVATGQTDWKPLMNPSLSNCIYEEGSWEMNDGILSANGGGYIWTKQRYGDFILDIEFKLADETNSGVFIRTGDLSDAVQTGLEVQIHETTDGSPRGQCGAIYDAMAPSEIAVKEPGKWNRYIITCIDNMIYVVLNGQHIITMDLNRWDTPHKNPDGSKNKFRTALKDMPRQGHIGLQYHGHPIWYRNMKIKPLD